MENSNNNTLATAASFSAASSFDPAPAPVGRGSRLLEVFQALPDGTSIQIYPQAAPVTQVSYEEAVLIALQHGIIPGVRSPIIVTPASTSRATMPLATTTIATSHAPLGRRRVQFNEETKDEEQPPEEEEPQPPEDDVVEQPVDDFDYTEFALRLHDKYGVPKSKHWRVDLPQCQYLAYCLRLIVHYGYSYKVYPIEDVSEDSYYNPKRLGVEKSFKEASRFGHPFAAWVLAGYLFGRWHSQYNVREQNTLAAIKKGIADQYPLVAEEMDYVVGVAARIIYDKHCGSPGFEETLADFCRNLWNGDLHNFVKHYSEGRQQMAVPWSYDFVTREDGPFQRLVSSLKACDNAKLGKRKRGSGKPLYNCQCATCSSIREDVLEETKGVSLEYVRILDRVIPDVGRKYTEGLTPEEAEIMQMKGVQKYPPPRYWGDLNITTAQMDHKFRRTSSPNSKRLFEWEVHDRSNVSWKNILEELLELNFEFEEYPQTWKAFGEREDVEVDEDDSVPMLKQY